MENEEYDLISVFSHIGDNIHLEIGGDVRGHYVAYRKVVRDLQLFNDNSVTKVTFDKIGAIFPNETIYLICYQRRSSILSTEKAPVAIEQPPDNAPIVDQPTVTLTSSVQDLHAHKCGPNENVVVIATTTDDDNDSATSTDEDFAAPSDNDIAASEKHDITVSNEGDKNSGKKKRNRSEGSDEDAHASSDKNTAADDDTAVSNDDNTTTSPDNKKIINKKDERWKHYAARNEENRQIEEERMRRILEPRMSCEEHQIRILSTLERREKYKEHSHIATAIANLRETNKRITKPIRCYDMPPISDLIHKKSTLLEEVIFVSKWEAIRMNNYLPNMDTTLEIVNVKEEAKESRQLTKPPKFLMFSFDCYGTPNGDLQKEIDIENYTEIGSLVGEVRYKILCAVYRCGKKN
jgi:hypothetical protein